VELRRDHRRGHALAGFEPDPKAVVQEVWLRVLQSAGTFSGRAKMSTWLHRITVNEAITAARRRRTHWVAPVGEVFDRFDVAYRTDPADPAQPVVDREHAAAVLPDLLALLPRDQRLVLEVLHLDGLTHVDAAQLLGVAVGTVKSRAHRAHSAIRAHPERVRHREGEDGSDRRGGTRCPPELQRPVAAACRTVWGQERGLPLLIGSTPDNRLLWQPPAHLRSTH